MIIVLDYGEERAQQEANERKHEIVVLLRDAFDEGKSHCHQRKVADTEGLYQVQDAQQHLSLIHI